MDWNLLDDAGRRDGSDDDTDNCYPFWLIVMGLLIRLMGCRLILTKLMEIVG